uniref:Uncharacterized protein n=1 Tax=Anguilla anguilla TaxID=7936 RepID=A0A0E9QHG6_ANGAN
MRLFTFCLARVAERTKRGCVSLLK